MDYLVFRLYGSMASWGEVAVGESRHSANHPGKSALLGLLAAALGIRRDDERQQAMLSQNYRFAVKQLSAGQLMRDYHTTQVPDSVGKYRYRTRRDEVVMGRNRLGTVLSTREYRSDSLALIAVQADSDALASLPELVEALRKPVFHLYLGRKSCPLAAPLAPLLITGVANLMAAFDSYPVLPVMPSGEPLKGWSSAMPERDKQWLSLPELQQYYWDGKLSDLAAAGPDFDPDKVQTLTRNDQPRSRKRWQFSPRFEHFYQVRAEQTKESV
ncbi:type I-E CRISPR-associated protein Cas5/CasD [Motiliproteus sp. MSK22-1]|uniref:type I-E CRISPR-associated protein Cas5/CasD n=1 Tax=Motiliproteus sp. MSK22-1 TaxID=1897630 RepID=UPI00097544C3|nr:type I-E CRISPR-associated protein Cas5/CasD [Motiliproteus sp. MSK22-1]OMH30527.1 type I-E CRISPR-associated protein Cas5/CasD [Motiliproteus sp. MSK22-1]